MSNGQGTPVVVEVILGNGERHSLLVDWSSADSAAAAVADVRGRYSGYSLPTAMTVISPNGAIPIQL